VHREGDVILDKYRLVRVLGEGGMGSVWLAKNLTLDVDVAVKLIRGDPTQPEGAWRLLQEARAAARLGHPSIVRVFDFGITAQSQPFIAMEVLQGESLREVLDRKERLDPIRAVRTLLPVASALAAAHEKGIVHRDFKPDNIVLTHNETGAVVPKIVDFGLAKLHRNDGVTLTPTHGTVLGSPGYMSPEQGSGYMEVDRRTDVWAFSVVLYEVLTGKYPFNGRDYQALLTTIIMNDPLPIKAHGVDDKALWSIVAKGLHKNPRQRWQDMRELGTALATWLVKQGIETDVAGNSLAAHWTKIDEHRPISGILPAPRSLPARPAKSSAGSHPRRLSQLPTLKVRTPVGGLSGKRDASGRTSTWVTGGRAHSAAQILAAAVVTGFVLLLGNLIGATAPANGPVAPAPRTAPAARTNPQRPPESRTVPARQSSRSRPAAPHAHDAPAAPTAQSASAAIPAGKPR
jgi:serine/threonine-protein kinase